MTEPYTLGSSSFFLEDLLGVTKGVPISGVVPLTLTLKGGGTLIVPLHDFRVRDFLEDWARHREQAPLPSPDPTTPPPEREKEREERPSLPEVAESYARALVPHASAAPTVFAELWEKFDGFTDTILSVQEVEHLRKYATRTLKISGASKLRKTELVSEILRVRSIRRDV